MAKSGAECGNELTPSRIGFRAFWASGFHASSRTRKPKSLFLACSAARNSICTSESATCRQRLRSRVRSSVNVLQVAPQRRARDLERATDVLDRVARVGIQRASLGDLLGVQQTPAPAD